jgi:hypothetical protein
VRKHERSTLTPYIIFIFAAFIGTEEKVAEGNYEGLWNKEAARTVSVAVRDI